MATLELHGVSRSFGDRLALSGVSFGVHAGRMTGFVGANGAGKTTTMRIVLGVLGADAGSVTLDGQPLTAPRRAGLGYMPEERGLYPKMRVAEHLIYLGRLRGLTKAAAARNAAALLKRLELAERSNATIESLSLGNQQRAQIAAALVHDPEVLVLDEPFSGLDPIAVDTVQAVLKERADRGAAVLFSSHQLDIVERICDDLVIIADGRIRAAGSRERLRAEHSGRRWELAPAPQWLSEVAGVTVVDASDGGAVFEADEAVAQAVLRRAVTEGAAAGAVERFARQHPSLAQIFREVIG